MVPERIELVCCDFEEPDDPSEGVPCYLVELPLHEGRMVLAVRMCVEHHDVWKAAIERCPDCARADGIVPAVTN
jgi:hypothetical protein